MEQLMGGVERSQVEVGNAMKHGCGTRGAAPTSDAAGRRCSRVWPRRATWIPRAFSRLAPMRLRLGPIRAESGRLGPKSAGFS